MLSRDLLEAAEDLVNINNHKPKQAHLRRAVSSVYYALFHFLAQQCADDFIGAVKSERSNPAWRQVYRSLEHKEVLQACKLCLKQPYNQKFPIDIQKFAAFFVQSQGKRHNADYDPFEIFYQSDIIDLVNKAKVHIDNIEKLPLKHRKAFSAFVLLGAPRK